MGYGVYHNNGRWAGYGVPALCDHPDCGADIDRGIAYMCGEEPGSEKGCGLFFCGNHLWISRTDGDPQMCERCCNNEPPFEPTPDTAEWVNHMLTDESWQEWRDRYPDEVERLSARPTGGRS